MYKRQQITVIEDERQALAAALEMARPGDLLLAFGDDIPACWNQIVGFSTGRGGAVERAERAERPVRDTVGGLSAGDLQIGSSGLTMRADPLASSSRAGVIVDERGVRLAREEND